MEDRVVNTIAVISVIFLITFVVIARVFLNRSKAFFLILGADVAVIIAIFAFVLIRRRFNRRRRLIESRLKSEGSELRIEYSFLRKVAGVPTKFRFQELEDATGGFQCLLGQGASASVFKGILNDGTLVAVKRINGEERGKKEFKSEVAAIASVQHVNLVRLIGSRILHLDIKPENILLDENFKAIVADLGLSKLMGKDESQVMTTVRGTRGYLAPEWLLEHGVSEKTDIYSYGMVLLEIVGGRRNVCLIQDPRDKEKKKWEYFPRIVNEKVRENKLMEIVDERLMEGGGVEEREVKRMVYVALWCIQERPRVRPNMKQVVEMLEGRVMVDQPPDTRMVMGNFFSMEGGEEDEAESSQTVTSLAAYLASQRATGNLDYVSTYSMATTVLSGR
ncbi:probable receptor-like protein kinase At5g20050 [Neltuma alba]|uniref:probable receptor-like protein kinase At5g20050 n=1 Tax=Neltuma alba TaxID=207710 RepID=UPI0010A59F95|nr:probable receptor-like protein kinase At5g20050 [Prosopis alba]